MRCPIKLAASALGGFEAPQGELALKGWMASIPCYRPPLATHPSECWLGIHFTFRDGDVVTFGTDQSDLVYTFEVCV